MKRFIVYAFAILICSLSAFGEETAFDGARWISVVKEKAEPNQWICFRKEFFTSSNENSAQLYIAVDSKYWLWVNGKLAVFEGGLKRGPNPRDTYYDCIDITQYLKDGSNQLAILLWYWGKDGFCHKSSGLPGLLADLYLSDGSHLLSDSSWKLQIHPAFGSTGAPYPNYRLPESNIHFDARNDIRNWYQPDYNDSDWAAASEVGSYPCDPWGKVHKRPFGNWRDSGVIKYESTFKEVSGDSCIARGNLPRNITVTPYLKVKAKSGCTIDIRTDNYCGGSEYNVRTEYVTREGEQEFETFAYMNGHSVIYTMPSDVEIIELGYRETRFDTEIIGSFTCNDSFYNTLWQKAANTMNLNMRDAIQDADRERSQWWGDAVIVAGEIYYACDQKGKLAVKKAIHNLVDWQKHDGVLFSPIPGIWEGELPQQMLASVGQLGFWNYYMYTADTATIRKVYPAVQKYLALFALDAEGLVEHRAGSWDWGDWGQNIDMRLLDNAWYALALEGFANMANLLGEKSAAEEARAKYTIIKNALNKRFWNGTLYRDPAYEGITDERGNALAALAGLADDAQWSSILSYLQSYQSASPYMEKYVLEAMLDRGNATEALQRMKLRYRQMVESPLTTLWEDWQIGGSGGGSINHGWAGGPLTLMSQYVAGVSPIEPGFRRFAVHPQLGNLSHVSTVVPTPYGSISVDIDRKDEKVVLSFEVPACTEAELRFGGETTVLSEGKYKIAFP